MFTSHCAVFMDVEVLDCPAQSAPAGNRRQGIKQSALACSCHLRLHAFAGTTWLERVAAHLWKSASGRSWENSISLSPLAFLNTADAIIHLNKAMLHHKHQPENGVGIFAHAPNSALRSGKAVTACGPLSAQAK